jgi:hypothetical protein
LIVSFDTRDLQRRCASLEEAEAWLGYPLARALLALLADAEAFDRADELVEFLGDTVTVEHNDSLSVAIGPNWDAVFMATPGTKFVQDQAGRTRWDSVTRLKLLEVACR